MKSAFTRLWTYLTYNLVLFCIVDIYNVFNKNDIKYAELTCNNESIHFDTHFWKINWGWQTFPKLKLSPLVAVTIIPL